MFTFFSNFAQIMRFRDRSVLCGLFSYTGFIYYPTIPVDLNRITIINQITNNLNQTK